MSAQISKAWARAAGYSVAVTRSRRRWKRFLHQNIEDDASLVNREAEVEPALGHGLPAILHTDPVSKRSDWLRWFCWPGAMQRRDGRSIPHAALEMLRERVVAMHEAGNAQLAITAALGLHKNTVYRWLKGWRVAGVAALKVKKRGRRHEAKRLLDAAQAAEVQQLMTGHCPDQLDLPWAGRSRPCQLR